MYDPDFDWDELEELFQAEETFQELPPQLPIDLADGPDGLGDRCRRLSCWQAHDAQVNVIRRAVGSQELYTGCWDSASVCHWSYCNEPSQLQDLQVGGFLNDFLELSPKRLLVAVSAGLIPTPGESLKLFDLSGSLPVQRCFFHIRGCRALAQSPDARWVASISKDALAVSTSETLTMRCVAANPHGLQEVMSLCWGNKLLFSGGTGGMVKSWELTSTSCECLWSASASARSWVRQMIGFDDCILVCHSDGMSWLDSRTGSVVGKLESEVQANAACLIEEKKLVVAFGRQLAFVDLRFSDSLKQDVICDFEALVSGLDSCSFGAVNLLAGLKNGWVHALEVKA